MARPKTKGIRSFALKMETLERLREVTEKSGIHGGASAIAEDAISTWLKRYLADPKGWLAARGVPTSSEPENDDL